VAGDAGVNRLEVVRFGSGLELVEQRGLAHQSGCEQQHVVGLEPVPQSSLDLVAVVEVLAFDRAPDGVSDAHALLLYNRSVVLVLRWLNIVIMFGRWHGGRRSVTYGAV
jgi:hypothetical protein